MAESPSAKDSAGSVPPTDPAGQPPMPGPASGGPVAASFPDLGRPSSNPASAAAIDLLRDVNLQVRVELGRTRMLVEDVLRLASDSVVELDKAAGDPVDIYVNGRHIARGEVLVLNEAFCVRISEIIEPFQVGLGADASTSKMRPMPRAEVA